MPITLKTNVSCFIVNHFSSLDLKGRFLYW